jgi:hypothetical protein
MLVEINAGFGMGVWNGKDNGAGKGDKISGRTTGKGKDGH